MTSAEAELEGLRAALESAGQRHAAQLASERQQAAQQLQRVKADLLNRARERAGLSAELEGRLDELVELVQREVARQEAAAEAQHQQRQLAAAAAAGRGRSRSPRRSPQGLRAPAAAAPAAQDVSWVPAVLQRVKALALDSERQQQRLQADLHIAQGEVAQAHSRVLGLEAALTRRTADWEAAEAAKQHLSRATGRRLEQSVGHVAERLKLQVGRRPEASGRRPALLGGACAAGWQSRPPLPPHLGAAGLARRAGPAPSGPQRAVAALPAPGGSGEGRARGRRSAQG
jgi:hypothetical protein